MSLLAPTTRSDLLIAEVWARNLEKISLDARATYRNALWPVASRCAGMVFFIRPDKTVGTSLSVSKHPKWPRDMKLVIVSDESLA